MFLSVNKKKIPIDKDGYLKQLNDWNKSVAKILAQESNIILTDKHWEIIGLARKFYQDYEKSPAMRALVKYTAKNLDDDKGNSIYLMQLFPGSPAKLISKIAGLPRPSNCL